MVHLENNVYCRKIYYKLALVESSAATHLARKLLEGVFKMEFLLKCTLSGRPPRAQGKDRQMKVVHGLNARAKDAIICTTIKYNYFIEKNINICAKFEL